MSETSQQLRQPRPRRRLREIKLPNGRTLMPRADFAHNVVGESERTSKRRNYPTTTIGGVIYVEVEGALQMIADSVKRRNAPAQSKRRGRRI